MNTSIHKMFKQNNLIISNQVVHSAETRIKMYVNNITSGKLVGAMHLFSNNGNGKYNICGGNGGCINPNEIIVGIIIPHYNSTFVREQILPFYEYFTKDCDGKYVLIIPKQEDDLHKFENDYVSFLQSKTSWKWSGQTELVAFAMKYINQIGWTFDFDKIFILHLDDLYSDGRITYLSEIYVTFNNVTKKCNNSEQFFKCLTKLYATKIICKKISKYMGIRIDSPYANILINKHK